MYAQLHGQLPTQKQSSTIKCFIKTESYNIEKKDGISVIKHGRGIMSRSDWAKVTMGPAITSIERKVYEVLKGDGDPYFIKHVPVPERFKYINRLRDGLSKYFVTDYTSFESSFSPEIMKAVECQMYRYMLPTAPRMADYLERTLTGKNHLKFRNGVSVTIKGRRMSGDMCTSLGNGFTNLMLMGFCAEKLGFEQTGFVEGDDGIFRVDHVEPAVSELLRKLGFLIKLTEVSDPALGGFCGIVAADNGNLKDPIRFLQTFGWTSSCVSANKGIMLALLRAKALSAQYELPQCPVIRAIADRALQLTTGVEPRFSVDGFHQAPPAQQPPTFEPTAATRELFSRLYTITPVAQLALEAQIRTCADLGFLEPYLFHDDLFTWYAKRFVGQ